MLKFESLYTLYEHIQQKQQKTVISKFESTLNDALKVAVTKNRSPETIFDTFMSISHFTSTF